MKTFFLLLIGFIGISLNILQAQIPTNGLVAEYSFDDTLNDAAGMYNLVSSGFAYETGRIGNAFKFTGSEECSNSDVSLRRIFDSNDSWSVNMWFNSSIPYDTYTEGMGDPSKALFACDGENNPPYKRTWILTDARGIMFSRMLGSGNGGILTATYSFVPDTWYHVSVNFNGTVGTIYINGTLAAATLVGDLGQNIGIDDANTTNVTIGGNQQNNVVQWKGLIDQVYVYNRVLSASEVKALYKEGKSSFDLNSGLVAFYKFNGNTNDESRNGNNGSASGINYVAGHQSTAAQFTSTSYVEIDDNSMFDFSSASGITINAWIRQEDGSNGYLAVKMGTGGSEDDEYEFSIFEDGTLSGAFNSPTTHHVLNSKNRLSLNKWYNVTLMWNKADNKISIYIDGILDALVSSDVTSIQNTSIPLRVGQFVNSNSFIGSMDDLRIWNRALSDDEVASLFNSDNNIGLVAYYPFNGNANDESGNGNNGDVIGASLTFDRFGNANSAYSFNGNSEINNVNDTLRGTFDKLNPYSINFWFNMFSAGNFVMFACDGVDEPPYKRLWISVNQYDTVGWLVFERYNSSTIGSVGGCGVQFFANMITPGSWYYISANYTGDDVFVYLNGVELTRYDDTGNWFTGASGHNKSVGGPDDLTLGTAIGGNFQENRDPFNGKIDDVRIYNCALTPSEIASLYNEPAPVTDIDGNIYNTVTIGTHTWMKENLKTTRYKDGTDIPLVTDEELWAELTTPGYRWYNNDEAVNKATYGALYNWYTVNTEKLCPVGWSVPTDAEWKTLEMYLGMTQAEADTVDYRGIDQGMQIKNTSGWDFGGNGTNSSGFSALPGGLAYIGGFGNIGMGGSFYCSNEQNTTRAWTRWVDSYFPTVSRFAGFKQAGMSVRCLKKNDSEQEILLPALTTKVGETFEIAVNTTELSTNDSITAYQFDYNYDISKLEYIGSSVAGTLAEGGSLEVNPTSGKLSVSWANATVITGTGTILKIQLKSLSAGETTPTITNALYNTKPVTAVNRLITSINKYGDIDENANIQAYDASLAIQYSFGLDPIPSIDALPWENWRIITANVDDTGSITANDASEILKYSVGLVSQFPVETGKKSASVSIADVIVGVVKNNIYFYSSGELFGLNISTNNTNQILGDPDVLIDNFMSAFNISGTTYNLGLCTAYSPKDGAAIMKIPYNKSGSITFNMIVNTVSKELTIDLVTGIATAHDNNINIYPNPVRDKLMISGLNEPATAGIYNTNGKLLLSSKIKTLSGEIDVAGLPAGVYVLKLQTNKEITVKRFMVK